MSDLKAAYDSFPIGKMHEFFDAMLAMRAKMLTLLHELDKEESNANQ